MLVALGGQYYHLLAQVAPHAELVRPNVHRLWLRVNLRTIQVSLLFSEFINIHREDICCFCTAGDC